MHSKKSPAAEKTDPHKRIQYGRIYELAVPTNIVIKLSE